MTDTSNDQPGKPDITIQAPSDMSAEQQKAVQATAAWMTDDMAQEVRKNPGGGFAKMIESSRGDQKELMRLVDRHGEQFLATLPRAVQDDIRALMQQNMKNNNDDDDFRRRKKLEEEELYGVAGIAGVRESNILELGRGEGGGSISLSSSIDGMDYSEKFQYFDMARSMTIEQIMALSPEEFGKALDNLTKDGSEARRKADQDIERINKNALDDPALGATPEARKAAMAKIDKAIDIDLLGKEAEANIQKLPKEWQDIAREKRSALRNQYHGENEAYYAGMAKDARDRGDMKAAAEYAKEGFDHAAARAGKNIDDDTRRIMTADMKTESGQKVADDAALKTEQALLKPMSGLDDEQKGDIKNSVEAEANARTQAHAQVAKQEFVQKAAVESTKGDDALGDEPSAPAQVASTSRKSIDIPDLNGKPVVSPESWMLAQLGKPMEAEKALEPELKPENQQPKAPKTTLET